MQNIDVRFNATSNFGKVKGDLAALEAQAASLNATFAKSAVAKAPMMVDSAGWKKASDAINVASREYRNAASSSGLLTTQQIRATSEAEKYTKALQKQKLSFNDMRKSQGVMREVYRDQLRMQRMTAQYWGTDTMGRAVTDIAIPKAVPRDLDTMRARMGMFGNMVTSASTQMVNLGKNIQWSGRQLTVGFTYPMVLFGAAAGVMAYKTEQAFAKINKVYDLEAGNINNAKGAALELSKLRIDSMEMATKAAKMYGSSLTSTLEVEQRLAATGLKGKELLTATSETQRISGIGDIESSQTADMIVTLKNAFRKDIGEDAQKLTDTLNFMNAVSNATSLSLQDIAEAIPRAGSAMASLNVTAKDTTILLAAMTENGIEAAEGANALKSAAARMLNPTILKKGTELFKSFGESIDVGEIAEKSKGDLMQFLKLLGEAENRSGNLTDKQKNSANAAIFGTYQFNRMTAALTNVSDAYGGVNNQTAKAIALQGESSESLAKMAENSRRLMIENPAGRFKVAWESLKIELAEVGEAFLKIGADALTMFSKIASGFNSMDDGIKKAALIGAGFVAILGPGIMLLGLFINLVGQIGKVFGWSARLASGFKLVTKEEQAATLSAEAQTAAMQRQISSTSTLAAELMVLTAAFQSASQAAGKYLNTSAAEGVVPRAGQPGFIGPLTKPNNTSIKGGYVPTAQERNAMVAVGNRNAKGQFTSVDMQLESARNRLANEYMVANNQVARDASKTEQRTAAINRQTASIKKHMSGAAIAGGTLTASMAAMMIFNNSMVDSIAKWAMVATLVVPALKASFAFMKGIAIQARIAAAAQMAGGAGNAMGTARAAGAGGTLLASAKGLAGGFAAAIGPVGAVALGVTAVTAGVLMWRNHLRAVREEQTRVHNSVNNLTKTWAENAGLVAKKYKEISVQAKTAKEATKQRSVYDDYNSGPMKQKVKDFNSFGPAEQDTFVAEHFLELMIRYGLSAEQASENVKALYAASGKGADEARFKAEELMATYGNMGQQAKAGALFRNQIKIFEGKEFGTDEAKTAAKDVASTFQNAFATANPLEAKRLWAEFTATANSAWQASYDDLVTTYSGLPQAFSALGINSAKELQDAVRKAGGIDAFMSDPAFNSFQGSGAIGEITRMLGIADQQEKMFFGNISKGNTQLGRELADNINTLSEFAQVWAVNARMMTMKEQIAEVRKLKLEMAGLTMNQIPKGSLLRVGPLGGILTHFDKIKDAETAANVNLLNFNRGLAQGANAAQAIRIFLEGITPEAWAAEQAAKGVGNAISGIPTSKNVNINITTNQELGNVFKQGMDKTMDEMVASANATFDASWDSKISDAQAANERAEAGMQASHEKAKKRIQDQIDAEKKADETRQRLFENEKTRLQRLAELQNNQIDFDTAVAEGRVDDAAKIANSMSATKQSNQMEDEQKAAEVRSQARIDALEKRSERLDKIQKRREAAMQRAHQNEIAGLNRTRDIEKANLDKRLEFFKSHTAANKKELDRWIRESGLSWNTFGRNILANGKPWSDSFQKSLRDNVRIAGIELQNEKMWENIGQSMADKLLKGMGFPSLAAFNKFVRTGKMPVLKTPANHKGGVVGDGGSGRTGYYGGISRNEQMILAEKGERITNKRSSKKYASELEAINNGTFHNGVMGGRADMYTGKTSAAYLPVAGMFAGAGAAMFGKGIGKSLQNFVNMRGNQADPAAGVGSVLSSIGVGAGFIPGLGGRHRPINAGTSGRIHDTDTGYPALDFAAPVGNPVYAVADGHVSASYDIPGYEPRAGHGGLGYKSYGRVVKFKTDAGPEVLYAHLSQRNVSAGRKHIPGGSILGRSGNTGNSSGPHLHFGSKGASPMAWLRKGGTVKWDNTPAMLHKGETVLTDNLTEKFKSNVASGGVNKYDIVIDLRGAVVRDENDIKLIKKAVGEVIDERNQKVGVKRVVH